MKKITFIMNGLLKRKDKLKQEIENFFRNEFHVEYLVTEKEKHATELSTSSINNKTDYLIAVGGDGTMNEVINGVMNVAKESRHNLIIGQLPIGSGNDFARTMKNTSSISRLLSLIKNQNAVEIDIGKLEYVNLNDKIESRFFNNISDIGLGGEVVKKVNESKMLLGPTLTFFFASVKAFFSYKRKKIKLTSADFCWEGKILLLCLANACYFGSGLCIAPHAKVNDGKIAVVIAGDIKLSDYLKNLSNIRKGKFIEHNEISYKEVSSCSIEPIDDNCLVEMDGELVGK
ncbi:MAG: diacylglycerol kinase family lipid kinase, partial [Ignavibacteria bacterium]|nr:diacylglycerol kinase family lipid kinase [Ignavibacteria bacterium]